MSIEPIVSRLIGVGELLKQQRLSVPIYQRPYTWELQQVKDLYTDIIDARMQNSNQYFLGTVVITTSGDRDIKNIIDGQQRIVTISILIAAIRNYFANNADVKRESMLTEAYISRADLITMLPNPTVLILPEDQGFYNDYIINVPNIKERAPNNLSATQKRLYHAIKEAQKTIDSIVTISKNPSNELAELILFIEKKVVLVSLDVGSEANAYVIFEVLNDRGLDLTVADLLKNYIFSISGKNLLPTCQAKWKEMTTLISNSHDERDIKNFIRHDWISRNGLIREKNLYSEIKKNITESRSVSKYIENLSQTSEIYAALSSIDSSFWQIYDEKVRRSLYLFNIANITQVRPLLISVFINFNKKEINITIPMLASWSVRFLIDGAVGGGELEQNYSQKAKDISDKKITTAKQLLDSFDILITDAQFESSFAIASVSKAPLARWYLSELELEKCSSEQKVVNADISEVNLEHIFPKNSDGDWKSNSKNITKYINRLGNQTLLKTKVNSDIRNSSFDKKKEVYLQSDFLLTSEIAKYPSWDIHDIDNRQKELAKLAVKRWKIKP